MKAKIIPNVFHLKYIYKKKQLLTVASLTLIEKSASVWAGCSFKFSETFNMVTAEPAAGS